MSPSEAARDKFIKDMVKQTGFSVERIKKILSERFGNYSISQEPKMRALILDIHAKEDIVEEQKTETWIEEYQRTHKLDPELCPYHNAVLYADTTLDTTKGIPGWQCSTGGVRCYWRWRTDRTRKLQGLEPIDWEAHDNKALTQATG
jgi:hypothetical protein